MSYRDENLRTSIIISASLHVGMMLVLYFGIPTFFKPPPAALWKPIPVDIVEIGAITNTRIRDDKKPEIAKTAPKTKPAPAEKVAEPKLKPSAPVPEVKPEPKPDDVTLPDPKVKPKPLPKKPVIEKPKPQPQVDPLASVLKNVAKLKPSPPKEEDAKPDDKKNDGKAEDQTTGQDGPALSDRLTISEEDALRRQISACWNMPIGARNAEDLIVEVLIEVNEDRTVQSAEIVDKFRYNTDSHFRAAAEAALRALHHPKCTPLELPPDEYEQWKTIRFNFDPRDML